MVIVVGRFQLDPADRDTYLASRIDRVKVSRSEPGCLAYGYFADPVDPSVVQLLEHWESQAAFDAHVAAYRAAPDQAPVPISVLSSKVRTLDVAAERPFPS